jgi:ADP-ribose pyrophosphatase
LSRHNLPALISAPPPRIQAIAKNMEKPSSSGWVRLRSEPGPELKLFRARFDWMRNPRNGKAERMIILESPDSANVVAVTPKERLVFVRQYRFGIARETLELPGGIVDAGEAPLAAAQRELAEETGYDGPTWIPLGKCGANPVFMDAWVHHFLVFPATPTQLSRLDEGEDVSVELLSVEETLRMFWAGEFSHPHTISALAAFFNHWNTKNSPPEY